MSMFTNLSSSFLGFDRLFDDLDRIMANSRQTLSTAGYPPLNLYKEGDGYTIELAVAGYKKTDISVQHDKKRGVLTVSGETSRQRTQPQSTKTDVVFADPQEAIHVGIASRKFTRSFTIADGLQVSEASLEDGLLTIKLTEIAAPEEEPLLIPLK